MSRKTPSTSIAALVLILAGCVAEVSAGPSAAAAALVADPGAGTGFRGAILAVDLATGQRTVLSDFGDPAQEPLGLNMRGVAVAPDGSLLVTDPFVGSSGLGALFAVDPASGVRILLSDFGDPAQGPVGSFPIGVAVGAAGPALVVDSQAGALFAVDLGTGQRSVLSDFGDPGQGPLGQTPVRVALDPATGAIWVADSDAGSGSFGALFRVDPQSGDRLLVSDGGDGGQGPTAAGLGRLAVEASGTVVVAHSDFADPGRLLRVEPVGGARSLVTDFADPGPVCQIAGATQPRDLAVSPEGTILVVTTDSQISGAGQLVAVDPASGGRSSVSCFADPVQGPTGESPFGVALPSNVIFADGFEAGDTGAWSATVQ